MVSSSLQQSAAARETPLTINYNFYQGFASPTDLPKMADAVEYASMIREMQSYTGVDEANKKFTLKMI